MEFSHVCLRSLRFFLSRECDLRLTWCEDELRHSLIVCLISGTPRSLKEALHPDRFASLISMIIVRRMAANSRQHLLDAIHINFYVDFTRCLLKSGGDGKVFGFCLFVCSNVNTTTTRTNERNVLHQLRHEGKFFFCSFEFSLFFRMRCGRKLRKLCKSQFHFLLEQLPTSALVHSWWATSWKKTTEKPYARAGRKNEFDSATDA